MSMKIGIHTQSESSAIWIIPLVDEKPTEVKPIVAYDDNNHIMEISDWDYSENVLTITFGFDNVSGSVVYAYVVDEVDLESDLENLKLKVDLHDVITHDNQARINNLEDRDLTSEFLIALNLATIKTYFNNETEVKINYGRKEISNIIVYEKIIDDTNHKTYEEITSGIKITYHEEYDLEDKLIEKYALIQTTQPVSGYALIL